MKVLLIVLVLMMQVAGANAENTIGEKATEFTLQDQYEKTVMSRHFEGQVVVLIACDREGSSQNAGWIEAVRDRYADRVTVKGVADVSSAPFFLKGKIRDEFKKNEKSILLDWKGEVFRSYGFAKAVTNIVLIDRHGIIRHRSSGPAFPEAVQELFRKIDALN